MASFESGEYDSSSWRAAEAAPSALTVAVRYWPGRWPRAVVLAGLAIESSMGDLDAQGWTALLDRIATTVSDSLADHSTAL